MSSSPLHSVRLLHASALLQGLFIFLGGQQPAVDRALTLPEICHWQIWTTSKLTQSLLILIREFQRPGGKSISDQWADLNDLRWF